MTLHRWLAIPILATTLIVSAPTQAIGQIAVALDPPAVEDIVPIPDDGSFVVHALVPESRLPEFRTVIQSAGLYGRISVGALTGDQLPYAANLINLVFVCSQSANAKEVMRVLAPGGKVLINDPTRALQSKFREAGFQFSDDPVDGDPVVEATKPWPDNIDEWTHMLHGADGNPVANDDVVAPPAHYQWVSEPRWAQSHESDSSIKSMVTARGRLLYIENQAPPSILDKEAPLDNWQLVARDAFNGMFLWQVPITEFGWKQWKDHWFSTRPGDYPFNIQKRLVADGDFVYATLGYRAPVSKLDARTGKTLMTYAGTERACEILYLDGKLLLSIRNDDGMELMSVDAATGKTLCATDRDYSGIKTDYLRWTAMGGAVDPPKVLAATLNTATDGKVIAFLDGLDIVGVSCEDGGELWRTPFPEQGEPTKQVTKIPETGTLWVGTTIVSNDVVIHASPTTLAGVSAKTGDVLWTAPKRHIQHLWYAWKDVFVIDGLVWTWHADLAKEKLKGGGASVFPSMLNGYDITTGKLTREVPLGNIFKTNHHHRCYRNKATVRYILASRRGTEFVDLDEGKHTVHNWVRGTCHLGMMPANGLQYAPPHPCKCYIDEKLSGMNALAPSRPQNETTAPQLVKGPAFGKVSGPQATDEDCPVYRQDNERSGAASTTLPAKPDLHWKIDLGDKPGAPISIGDKVFLPLVDAHQLVALNRDDGSRLWSFTAGGRIDSPPAYHNGALTFGSRDGHVYCVRASDGALVWRFRAAPRERLMGAYGQLESTWPVHGSPLVWNDVVYFVAGRSSHLDGGLLMYGLDAMTGEQRCLEIVEGPFVDVESLKDGENFRQPMGTLPDIPRLEDDAIALGVKRYDAQWQVARQKPKMQIPGGYLDDSYFKRIPWRGPPNVGYGRLISECGDRVYCARMFDSLQGLSPHVYFAPGTKGFRLFANDTKGKEIWSQRVPIRIQAMVATDNLLCVAGPPDVKDPQDPRGAFEGRKGAILELFNNTDGASVVTHKLPSLPVFNGAIAANSRLFVAMENGGLACFAE